ncbi:MAG: TonB-dependent receptor domain-containing protein, partial [Myxococcaceae bacterium]
IYSRQGGEDLFCAELPMLREGTLVDTDGNVTDKAAPGMGDGDQYKLGVYFQYLTTLPGKIGLLLGGRVDEKFGSSPQLSPRVSLVVPLGELFYLKSQYTSAFVYPAFVYETGNSLSDYQGSQDLKPQTVQTAELLAGFKNDFLRGELSVSYNRVANFITFDLDRNARSGQFKFTNQGDVSALSVEATGLVSLLGGKVGLRLHGAYVRPLPGTNPLFLVDGQLGGPTKFPALSGAASVNIAVAQRVNVHLGALFNGFIAQRIPSQAQFQGITGQDGIVYSSIPAETYPTASVLDQVSITWWPFDNWSLALKGSNLLNQRIYRPGSVLVPQLLDGRQITGSISCRF